MASTITETKTVLIADDDTDLCEAIAARCRSLGAANDAASAWRIVDFSKPDLICLDVDMPRGNGLQSVR